MQSIVYGNEAIAVITGQGWSGFYANTASFSRAPLDLRSLILLPSAL